MPFKQTAKKYIKKQGKRLLKYGANRYFKGGKAGFKNIKVDQIVKDVAKLKSVINAEKKYVEITPFGQPSQFTCNVAGTNLDTGYYITDITPAPAEGVTVSTRSGMSIKLHSCIIRLQLSGMTNTANGVKLSYHIFQNMGETQTINATLANKLFNVDALSLFTDANSLRNPAYFHNFKCICKRTLKLPQDTVSGLVQTKDYTLNLRLNHHIRYNYDTTTVSQGQLILMVLADTGNNGSANAVGGFVATTPPITTAQSGVNLYQNYRFFYYDN